MGRITSYDENGRLMADFDKSAYGPCWYYRGQPQTTGFAAPNEGVKLAANLRRLEEDNAKLRELVAAYDSALHRLCDQTQGHVDCDGCILGKDYRNEDVCALDELRDSIMGLGVEVDE